MLKTVDDIKNLVLWAKEQKIKNIQIGEIVFQYHDSAFHSEVTATPTIKMEDQTDTELDKLLYHSAN